MITLISLISLITLVTLVTLIGKHKDTSEISRLDSERTSRALSHTERGGNINSYSSNNPNSSKRHHNSNSREGGGGRGEREWKSSNNPVDGGTYKPNKRWKLAPTHVCI